jgi:hypothetical protein
VSCGGLQVAAEGSAASTLPVVRHVVGRHEFSAPFQRLGDQLESSTNVLVGNLDWRQDVPDKAGYREHSGFVDLPQWIGTMPVLREYVAEQMLMTGTRDLQELGRPRRFGARLSLAADCVSRCGATDAVPELDAIADSKGRSETVRQARRLRECLAGTAG